MCLAWDRRLVAHTIQQHSGIAVLPAPPLDWPVWSEPCDGPRTHKDFVGPIEQRKAEIRHSQRFALLAHRARCSPSNKKAASSASAGGSCSAGRIELRV